MEGGNGRNGLCLVYKRREGGLWVKVLRLRLKVQGGTYKMLTRKGPRPLPTWISEVECNDERSQKV